MSSPVESTPVTTTGAEVVAAAQPASISVHGETNRGYESVEGVSENVDPQESDKKDDSAEVIPEELDLPHSDGEEDLDEIPDSLNPQALQQGLIEMAKKDERFEPFLKLLIANDPEASESEKAEATHEAVKQMQDMRQEEQKRENGIFFHAKTRLFSEIKDPDIEEVVERKFSNWGETVRFDKPTQLVVHTKAAVCKVVTWAMESGRRVRVAGFRHSWTNFFGESGDVIIMFKPYRTLAELPYEPQRSSWKTDLKDITLLEEDGKTALCRVGAGCSNDEFREWAFRKKTYTYELSVIMTEVTFGGTNAPICHGSGFETQTLSDLVREVEYVDANGKLQTVSDPKELAVASGCFGLLGIVVSLTLKLIRMEVAHLVPAEIPLILAIPPPDNYPIPMQVSAMMPNVTKKQLEQAKEDFKRRCDEDFYLEWFWFPYQKHCWVNTWKKRPMTQADVRLKTYPDDELTQKYMSYASELITSLTVVKWARGYWQAYLFGLGAMAVLPSGRQGEQDALTVDALHFRRGIQNFRCLDTEWEIPIPWVKGKRHYETIQRAWWDAITEMYKRPDAPVRVALEMRLTGDSNVILAPQRGNKPSSDENDPVQTNGTIAIEVLTTLTTNRYDPKIWASFKNQIADKWTSYRHPVDQSYLNVRPHWAKEWSGVRVRGQPIEEYLRGTAYKDAFAEFRTGFKEIVERRGGSVETTLKRFGNKTMQDLIWG